MILFVVIGAAVIDVLLLTSLGQLRRLLLSADLCGTQEQMDRNATHPPCLADVAPARAVLLVIDDSPTSIGSYFDRRIPQ